MTMTRNRTSIAICALLFAAAIAGCTGAAGPTSPATLAPTVTLDTGPSTVVAPTGQPAVIATEPGFEPGIPGPRARSTPCPAPLPDLTPPRGGWIAFLTPEDHLVLVSPDGTRQVSLADEGRVTCFSWSPDGRWLAFSTSTRLLLASIERSQLVVVSEGQRAGQCAVTWSQDSSHLAYLYDLTSIQKSYGAEMRLYDLASGQTTTIGTYPRPGETGEIAALCSQPFPSTMLPVVEKVRGSLHIWDPATGKTVVSLNSDGRVVEPLRSVGACTHLWLTGGKGLIFPRQETGKRPVRLSGVLGGTFYPVSLSLWMAGDDDPVTLLQAQEGQSYWPVRWLPDGRLEVLMTQWDKDKYDGPAEPEHVQYRHYKVNEQGESCEASDGDLPWWAGGGLQKRLSQAGLQPPQGRLGQWEVGADGETVVFAWARSGDGQEQGAVYLWRGEGEPVRLAMGYDPQWQPVQSWP